MDYKTARQLVDNYNNRRLPNLIITTDSLIEQAASKGRQGCYTPVIDNDITRKALIDYFKDKGFIVESTPINEVRISWTECKTQTKD